MCWCLSIIELKNAWWNIETRNVCYYNVSEYAVCPQQVQSLLTHSVLVVWATDDKLYRRSLWRFILAQGGLEWRIISVYLFWVLVTHISLLPGRKIGVKMNQPQTMCWYKHKRRMFCITFRCYLSQISWSEISSSNCFLIVRLLCFSWLLLFIPKVKDNTLLHADWLALSCIKVCFGPEKRTDVWAWQR